MSKAMRPMPGQPGRVGVARGEAVRDLTSDEADGPPREYPGTGSAMQTSTGWACHHCHDLKLSNLPVRTRMPGGVAGVPPTGGPLCRSRANSKATASPSFIQLDSHHGVKTINSI